MPIYDMQCESCGLVEERSVALADRDQVTCSACDSVMRVKFTPKARQTIIPANPLAENIDASRYNYPKDAETKKRWDRDCVGSCRWV